MFLIDSVIIIDHLNGISKATRWLEKEAFRSRISLITRIEVLAGYDDLQSVNIARLLNQFQIAELTPAAADYVAKLRRQHCWKLPDALQAGLALFHGYRLVTRNTKDFPSDRFDFVLVPYTI